MPNDPPTRVFDSEAADALVATVNAVLPIATDAKLLEGLGMAERFILNATSDFNREWNSRLRELILAEQQRRRA